MTSPAGPNTSWPVVELRRYTLHPGTRETLIALFDREFVETQEECGMDVIAQFRDIDHPDVFTWLRGFTDMGSRKTALAAFYDGPAWTTHRDMANATMIDSDNVRLLLSRDPASGFERGEGESSGHSRDVHSNRTDGRHDLYDRTTCECRLRGLLRANDCTGDDRERCATARQRWKRKPAENTFPRLPVREGEHAFVWFAQFDDVSAYNRHRAKLCALREWTERKHALLEGAALCAGGALAADSNCPLSATLVLETWPSRSAIAWAGGSVSGRHGLCGDTSGTAVCL